SPRVPVHTSDSTRPEKMRASVLAISQCIVMAIVFSAYLLATYCLLLRCHFRSAFDCFLDAAHHVEGLLGQMVVVAVQDALEAGNGVFQRYVLAFRAGENLGNGEGLREETFDLASAAYGEFVVFRQF